ncbi:MAG: winged helix-turn-helix transcriptional regulator [Myxococcota bacterium]
MTGFRYAQLCPLARAAEILGERWTLLVIRELFCGPQRFSDLRRRLPGVSTSVLSERLARLEEREIVARRTLPAPAASQIYELAEAGRALAEPLGALMRWGLRWLEPREGDHFEPEWFGLGLRFFARRDATRPLRARLTLDALAPEDPPAVDWIFEGGPDGVAIRPAAERPPGAPEPGIAVAGGALPLMGFVSGQLPVRDLVAAGSLRTRGDIQAIEMIPELFDFSPDGPAEAEGAGA